MRWLGTLAVLLSVHRGLGGAWDDEAVAPRHSTTRFLRHYRSHLTAEHHAMAGKEEDLIDTTVITYSVIVVERKVSPIPHGFGHRQGATKQIEFP